MEIKIYPALNQRVWTLTTAGGRDAPDGKFAGYRMEPDGINYPAAGYRITDTSIIRSDFAQFCHNFAQFCQFLTSFLTKTCQILTKRVIFFNTNMLCNKKLSSFRVKPDISLSGRIRMATIRAGYRMEPDIRYILNENR